MTFLAAFCTSTAQHRETEKMSAKEREKAIQWTALSHILWQSGSERSVVYDGFGPRRMVGWLEEKLAEEEKR